MLGYRRDDAASALRRADRVSSSIGLVFEDVANPFLSYVHRAIEDVARARGRPHVRGQRRRAPGARARARARVLRAPHRRLDHRPRGNRSQLPRARARCGHRPRLRRPPARVPRCGHRALRQCRGHGESDPRHGRAAVTAASDSSAIAPSSTPPRSACRGYRDALSALGIAEDPALVRANLANPASTDAAVRELFALPDPPTALFAGQNLITVATLHTLRALGLHQSIAVIGFDDFELADLLEPPVTVSRRMSPSSVAPPPSSSSRASTATPPRPSGSSFRQR